MAILDDVKGALRISNNAYDIEITGLIDAAKADLKMAGVYFVEIPLHALIQRAIILYVKSNFGFDNPDADRLNDSYIMLKQHLCLSVDFKEVVV